MDAIRGKTLFISGASGMIGSFIVDTLMEYNVSCSGNINIYALSRNIDNLKRRFSYWYDSEHGSIAGEFLHMVEADISSGHFDLRIEADYYISAASNTHPLEYSGHPIDTIMTNVMGTYNVFDMANTFGNHGCRLLLVSSVEIYGSPLEGQLSLSEDDMGYLNCNSLRAGYPESKRTSEALMQAFIKEHSVNASVIRLCRIYGATVEEDDSKASSQFIRNILNGDKIVLKSPGKQVYSYLYLPDAVSAIFYVLLLGEKGMAYNAADDASNISLREMAEYLARLAHKNVVYDIPSKEEQEGFSSAKRAVMESSKLKKLGWKPEYSIEPGLENTLKILGIQIDS